jgi:hypothetical protein
MHIAQMSNRKPAYGALVVIGLAFLPLAIAGNTAFWRVAAVFFIVGATGWKLNQARS